ncbi:MAG: hypothetical protein K8F91_06355, partial [Candidatus Obscuribacterales bacterium]|nr:hypothetical protein [Candidatus Obscuribacterales bacterium]
MRHELPGYSIGSVDKFQGQDAPVVIVSMCSSSADTSPRAMEFVFSKNRLNVAISRAQSLAVVVGSPSLARNRCQRVEQMKLVNLYCRIIKTGSEPLESGGLPRALFLLKRPSKILTIRTVMAIIQSYSKSLSAENARLATLENSFLPGSVYRGFFT